MQLELPVKVPEGGMGLKHWTREQARDPSTLCPPCLHPLAGPTPPDFCHHKHKHRLLSAPRGLEPGPLCPQGLLSAGPPPLGAHLQQRLFFVGPRCFLCFPRSPGRCKSPLSSPTFAFASVGVLWFSLIWDQMISLARIPLSHELCEFSIHTWPWVEALFSYVVGNISHS